MEDPLAVPLLRDPNKFERMLTDWGVAFLNGSANPRLLSLEVLAETLSAFGGAIRGGGGRGGGTFRSTLPPVASKGESSQFVVGVYLWIFPVWPVDGGGAGAGLVGFCIYG